MNTKQDTSFVKIGYITENLAISPRTIRHYDQFGLLPHMKRSEGNVRLFDAEDIALIKKIKQLQKQEKMSLEHIRAYLFGDVDGPAMKQAIVVDATLTPLKEKDVFVCACKMKIGSHSLAANQGTKAEDLWSILKKNQDSGQVLLPKKELLLKQYQHLIDSGYERIYSIHCAVN